MNLCKKGGDYFFVVQYIAPPRAAIDTSKLREVKPYLTVLAMQKANKPMQVASAKIWAFLI